MHVCVCVCKGGGSKHHRHIQSMFPITLYDKHLLFTWALVVHHSDDVL